MVPELYAWRGHELVGRFRGGHRSTTFTYEDGVTVPISLSLPIDRKPRRQAAIRFLDNLLPEGLGARKSMMRALGAKSESTFDLLDSVDSAGGLIFTRTSEEPQIMPRESDLMLDDDIAAQVARINAARGDYSQVDPRARFSIAGQQGKFTATYLDRSWYWPSAALPSTHIFKPDMQRPSNVARYEHACMMLAALMGNDVPSNVVERISDVDVYIITRFDREVMPDGTVRRIHTEDMCQSLGLPSEEKYEPRAVDIANVLRDGGVGEEGLLEWFSHLVTCVLLGDADAHAKNYSVFLDSDGIRPTPMYDVITTMVWPVYTTSLAMSVNGKDRAGDIGLDDWRHEAGVCGIDPDVAEERVCYLAGRLWDAIPKIPTLLAPHLVDRLVDVLCETTRTLQADMGVRMRPDFTVTLEGNGVDTRDTRGIEGRS